MKVDNNFGYSLEGAAYEPEVEEIIAEPNFETLVNDFPIFYIIYICTHFIYQRNVYQSKEMPFLSRVQSHALSFLYQEYLPARVSH